MDLFETTGSLIVALGKTIIHSVWIGLLILAMLRMALLAIPGRLSNLRYLVSVTSLVLLAGTVFTAFLLLFSSGSPAGGDLMMFEAVRFVPQILVKESYAGSRFHPNLLFTLCSYLYFAGMAFMVFRSVFSFRYIRSLRNSSQAVTSDWQEKLERISKSLGIRKEVTLLQSIHLTGPLLVGFLKPAVIVPVGMFTHLSVSQVETILIHELYHLKRLDYLVNIMQLFMEGVLFYNPAAWYISDIIRQEREHCCDDGVVQTSNDPVDYAKALVQLAEQQHYIRLAPGAGGSSKDHFVTRIKRIINRSNMKKNMQERVMSLLLFVGAIMVVLVITGFSSGFSIVKQSDRITEILVQPVDPLPLLPVVSTTPIQDTIRSPKKPEPASDEEIDWDQMKEDIESAKLEALEEIDWDQIKEDIESAKQDAFADIDWEEMKAEMDSAIQEIDFDFDMDFDVDIDLEAIRENMEEARREMEEIDWEKMKQDIELSISEMQINVEEMKREIEESINEIDWDEIREDMKNSRRELDSQYIEKDI